MKNQKKRVVTIQEDDATVEIELDQRYFDFYKKETGHTHVTQRGLSKFVKRLVELFQS